MTIPATTKRRVVHKPMEVDRITFVVTEDQLRSWIREKITDGIGPHGVKLTEVFSLTHELESGEAALEVAFDVPVISDKEIFQ